MSRSFSETSCFLRLLMPYLCPRLPTGTRWEESRPFGRLSFTNSSDFIQELFASGPWSISTWILVHSSAPILASRSTVKLCLLLYILINNSIRLFSDPTQLGGNPYATYHLVCIGHLGHLLPLYPTTSFSLSTGNLPETFPRPVTRIHGLELTNYPGQPDNFSVSGPVLYPRDSRAAVGSSCPSVTPPVI